MVKKQQIEEIERFCNATNVKPQEINSTLEALNTAPLHKGCKIAELLGRPQVSMDALAAALPSLKAKLETPENRKEEIAEAVEIRIKYKGYIEREQQAAEKMHRLEDIKIKGHFQYDQLTQISIEARQKLTAIDPETLAQASRIPGVSPSDINALLVLSGR